MPGQVSIRRVLCCVALVVVSSWAVGCSYTGAVVAVEGAPLYADRARTEVRLKLEKLEFVELGLGEPDGPPASATVRGVEGYVDLAELRTFRYESPSDLPGIVRRERREVVLLEKPWPPFIKGSIRGERIRTGMTPEMVELSWGVPTQVASRGATTTWTYDRTRYRVQESVSESWGPRLGYGFAWGYGYSGFGVGMHWGPEVHVERAYIPERTRRTVDFDEGLVVGWR